MLRQTARRILLASTLVLGVSANLTSGVLAAEDGGNQQGEVPIIETVDYVPASKFNFTPNTAMTGESFGTVNVQSNANGGWTLSVKSLKGANLENLTLTGTTIAYSLKVDNVSVDVSTPDTYAVAKDVSALTCSAAGGCTYNVTADITAAASNGKPAGTYQDTITFKLINK